MARKATIERNNKVIALNNRYENKRKELKAIIKDKDLAVSEKFDAVLALDKMSKNSSKVRIKNRCRLTGRGRGYYRKFGISRIELRRLALEGLIPGVKKSSW